MRVARVPGLTVAHGTVILHTAVGIVAAHFRYRTRVYAFRVHAIVSRVTVVVVRAFDTRAFDLKQYHITCELYCRPNNINEL